MLFINYNLSDLNIIQLYFIILTDPQKVSLVIHFRIIR